MINVLFSDRQSPEGEHREGSSRLSIEMRCRNPVFQVCGALSCVAMPTCRSEGAR
jgi:hypothetical protein